MRRRRTRVTAGSGADREGGRGSRDEGRARPSKGLRECARMLDPWGQPDPDGGAATGDGRHGATKPVGVIWLPNTMWKGVPDEHDGSFVTWNDGGVGALSDHFGVRSTPPLVR